MFRPPVLVAAWGWRGSGATGLALLVAEPRPGFDAAALGETLRRSLSAYSVQQIPVIVDQVGSIPRAPNGKAPLVRAIGH